MDLRARPSWLLHGLSTAGCDYSPDGSHILFGSAPSDGLNEDLYVMNADGTGIQVVVEAPEYENHGIWK